jgi:hypothetical protein
MLQHIKPDASKIPGFYEPKIDFTLSKKERLINYNDMIGKETKHIRNKDEAKLLRQIMSESKLSEEEVIKIPKYRKMLSDIQRNGEKSNITKYGKRVREITKRITKELKLAKEHPLVVERVKVKINSLKQTYGSWWYWH